MSAINRKLLREVWRLKGQMISIALVVACGVLTVVMMRSTYDSLEAARASYYETYRFADVFASAVRAPEPVARRVAEIEGVTAAESRIVVDVSLDMPGMDEPARGRLVSLPDLGEPAVNGVHLVSGRMPDAGARNEILASEMFAEAHGLLPGDGFGAVVNGRWERLEVVGTGISPEYVYEIDAGQLYPDHERFGVLWIRRGNLETAYAMEGAFNDISLRLARDASLPAVIAEVDRLLDPYGGFGAYGREDQISNLIVTEELNQNRVMGTVVPFIFLMVAAFILHMVLSRMIRTQREEIAVLKAFGYGNAAVARHYVGFAMVPVGAGALIGVLAGLWLGGAFLDIYAIFFRFPDLEYRMSGWLVAGAVGVAAIAAAVGALAAVRRAVALPPAEAMRPEAPARFRPGWIERIGLGQLFTPVGRMVIRSLERQPLRSALSALGVGLALSILVVGAFMFDAIGFMMDHQFRTIQREDVTVTFNTPRSNGAIHDLASMEGVLRVEPFRSVPARIHAENRTRNIAITGMEPDAELRRVIGTDLRQRTVPDDGILLSEALAEVLGVRTGDQVRLEILEGRRPTYTVPVSGTVDELLGMGSYMSLDALNRVLREAPAVSGAHLRVDPLYTTAVYDQLKMTPAVAGVAARETMLRNFERQIEENILVSVSVLILFAGIIAIGVIYNGARIALSERGRELASLRVLGFTRREVAGMLFGEQAIVTALGIPVGLLIGYAFARMLIESFATESYRIPLVIEAETYLLATSAIVFAAVLAGLLVRRRLNRLDLIAVLKTRE